MDLHVSVYEAKLEKTSKDFFITELDGISPDTTLTEIFNICWKKQSHGAFNWPSFTVVATCRGQRLLDLSQSLNQLNLHLSQANDANSRRRLSLEFVARNQHKPVSPGSSSQLVQQTLHSLHSAALLPGGIQNLCKAARQLDVAEVPGLGEDRRAFEIITDYRLQAAMLRRPRLLQQLVRSHPALANAIVFLSKRVAQTAQAARLPTSSPASAAAVAGNMPLGANYNVDFDAVLDEDEENGDGEEGAAGGAAAAAAYPRSSRPSSAAQGGGSGASAISGAAAAAAIAAAAAAAAGGPPGSGGRVSSDFLRNAMAQAFTIIPARQRFAVQLRALRDMGITDEEAALRILEQNNGDLELTIDNMFSS